MMSRSKLIFAVGAAAMLFGGCVTIAPCPVGGIAQLACEADKGDKSAQLRLGVAYENGSAGVPVDLQRAASLYRAAAAPVLGTTFVYSPPVGKAPGQVIPVRTGSDQPGLAEAQYRLAVLHRDGRGVKKDLDRANQLFAQARAQGYQGRAVP
jgi:hypothetical protein